MLRRAGQSRALPIVALALLFLGAMAPILATKIPPLDDYINHLARMQVILAGGHDPLLDRFYAIEWRLVPNLAMDLIVPPLARLVGLYMAGKLFVLAYMTLLATGPMAIHYALYRRLSLGPLTALLFLYNGANSWGLVNYLFGVGLALWGIAAWIAWRDRYPLRRAVVSLAFTVALFFCHLSAVGLYGLGLLSYEAWRVIRRDADRPSFADAAALIVPLLAVPALLAVTPTEHGALSVWRWEAAAKLQGVWQVVRTYVSWIDLPVALLMAGLGLLAWRRGMVRLHPAGWWFLAGAMPIYLAMPTEMMSAWGADVRLPIGFAFILIGYLDWRLPTPRARLGFVAMLAALLVLRVGIVAVVWRDLDRVTARFEESLAAIPPGSRILIAEAADPERLHPVHYLPCLATIERSSLVSLDFSNPKQQILVVRPPYRAVAGGYHEPLLTPAELRSPPTAPVDALPAHRIYWRHWTEDYDYLYLMASAGAPDPAPGRLERVFDGGDFRLYRIRHPE